MAKVAFVLGTGLHDSSLKILLQVCRPYQRHVSERTGCSASCQFISMTYHQPNHMEQFAFHCLGPVLSSGWWSSFESSQGRLDFKRHYSIMYEMWHGHKASHYTMWYQSACKAAKNCHMNSKIFRNLGRLYSGLGRGRYGEFFKTKCMAQEMQWVWD